MNDVELVQVTRGDVVDCVHRGRVVIADTAGDVCYTAGDPDAIVFLRSSAKPFQALAVVRTGAVDKFGLSEEELAIIAGSHIGTAHHTALVEGIHAKLGIDETALQCGVSAPLDQHAGHQHMAAGGSFSTLHHNCSGKHSGMLAACLAQGWDTATYHHADHPLQQLNRAIVAEYAGMAPEDVVLALDGCGVPTFGLPLRNIAQMFARFAQASTSDDPMGRVARAMQAYPYSFSGAGQVDATLVDVTGGRLVAKGGAEGLMCIGVPGEAVGIALKVSDGSTRAHVVVLAHLLLANGYISAAENDAWLALRSPVILNNRGERAGELRAVLDV